MKVICDLRSEQGFNGIEALIFFQASLFQLLRLEVHCEDHISPSNSVML